MSRFDCFKALGKRPVIPAVRSETEFIKAVATSSPYVITLFGDIFSIPRLVRQAQQNSKIMLLHVDLIEGVGKDKCGIKYLSQLGIRAIISTKPQLIKIAREEGVFAVQRLFLMDSEALRTGLAILKSVRPDALEVLPGWVPGSVVDQLAKACSIPVMAGGMITTRLEVDRAITSGICAVSTTKQELWDYCPAATIAAGK